MPEVLSLIHHIKDGIEHIPVLLAINALVYEVKTVVKGIRSVYVREHSLTLPTRSHSVPS